MEHFTFAGFNWPRPIVQLPRNSLAARAQARRFDKSHKVSPYYHAPRPLDASSNTGRGFYMHDAGMPGLRCEYVDAIDWQSEYQRINSAWYADEFGDTVIRGIIFRLPHSRGFLAGWTMGEHMSAAYEPDIYETLREAARAADDLAERTAAEEREYSERWRAAVDLDENIADACATLRAIRAKYREHARALGDARRAHCYTVQGVTRATMRDLASQFDTLADSVRDWRAERAAMDVET